MCAGLPSAQGQPSQPAPVRARGGVPPGDAAADVGRAAAASGCACSFACSFPAPWGGPAPPRAPHPPKPCQHIRAQQVRGPAAHAALDARSLPCQRPGRQPPIAISLAAQAWSAARAADRGRPDPLAPWVVTGLSGSCPLVLLSGQGQVFRFVLSWQTEAGTIFLVCRGLSWFHSWTHQVIGQPDRGLLAPPRQKHGDPSPFLVCRGLSGSGFQAPRPRRTSSGVSAGVGGYYVPHPSDPPDLLQWEVRWTQHACAPRLQGRCACCLEWQLPSAAVCVYRQSALHAMLPTAEVCRQQPAHAAVRGRHSCRLLSQQSCCAA